MREAARRMRVSYNSVRCPECGKANQIMMEEDSVVVCKHCRSKIFTPKPSLKKAG